MGVDLELIAIPLYKVFEMTANPDYYADMVYEIQYPGSLKEELVDAKAREDSAREAELMDLIEDAQELLQTYPVQNPKLYQFASSYRGYSTLNFLLNKHCKKMGIPEFHFFEGKTDPLGFSSERPYLEVEDVLRIGNLLPTISFKQLLDQYDYDELGKNAYKATRPENLIYLEEEYRDLVSFFKHAAEAKAYVLIHFY